MIRRLQIKLITTAMLSLALVLAVIFGIVALRSFRTVASNADEILDILAENEGQFPDTDIAAYMDGGELWSFSNYNYEEIPYESRYFSVMLTKDGGALSADLGQIAAVDETDAMDYAHTVLDGGRERGFIEGYRYIVQTLDDGAVRIIFLDCGRLLSTYRLGLFTTVVVTVAGLAAVLLVMMLLSKRIIRPIVESYEKQRRFITDAGHEIKTPLTIIDADAEVLAMELGEENEWLLDIQTQTHRLTELTKSLIFLSRMQEDVGQEQMIDFPVSDVVSETAQSFQSLAKTQDKVLMCQVQPLLTLRGDEKGVRQLVSILLDNALKYSPQGGVILLTLGKAGKANLQLSVENPAPNLTKKDMEHMFDRFYRGDESHNSQTGGYGIGLSIAKAIVSAQRGRIAAASRENGNLVITITLPGLVTESPQKGE
ncbi:MAG: HAMP domain-containing histidine kinase [Oscillospiraceae bacterium]|nr:HAMP domain-containing histidine kinase [Oscillospiraceae bacterium]